MRVDGLLQELVLSAEVVAETFDGVLHQAGRQDALGGGRFVDGRFPVTGQGRKYFVDSWRVRSKALTRPAAPNWRSSTVPGRGFEVAGAGERGVWRVQLRQWLRRFQRHVS